MNDFGEWIAQYGPRLSFEYGQFDWTQKLDVELHDLQCEFMINGKSFLGRGTHSVKDTAIVKATAETLERYFLDQMPDADTSNGVAIHSQQQHAELNALCELLERDSFFCHFLTKTPFKEITEAESFRREDCRAIIKYLQSLGAEVRFGSMRTHPKFHGVICAVFGLKANHTFGMTLGTSTQPNLHDALYSALVEAVRSALGYLLGTVQRPQSDLRRRSVFNNMTPQKHLELALDPAYAVHFRDVFFDAETGTDQVNNIDLNQISISSFKTNLNNVDSNISPPLLLARASSSDVLNLYFGSFNKDARSLRRLSAFLGRQILEDEVNSDLHPFG